MTVPRWETAAPRTWCPGCGNFAILNAVKAVLTGLADGGTRPEDLIMVAGIGCHAKIADYLAINSVYSLHGRSLPVATAVKLARPGAKVIVFAGDGDAYGEGLEHLLFAAKRDVDITLFVHDNRVYGLTTGQTSPTSPHGFRGRSTPAGAPDRPFNPLELALAAGATFVGRGYSNALEGLKGIMRAAVDHPGFALVDILQVCATFYNRYDAYNRNAYGMTDHDPSDIEAAVRRAREWDYDADARIPLGVFYRAPRAVPVGSAARQERPDRANVLNDILSSYR